VNGNERKERKGKGMKRERYTGGKKRERKRRICKRETQRKEKKRSGSEMGRNENWEKGRDEKGSEKK